MAWLDCEWVVVSWKMQYATHLRLVFKMLVCNVGCKNVWQFVCTVMELLQPLQSIVDVQACIGIVTTIKLLCSWAVVDLFRPAFV
jgi:hypothetical protein